MENVKILMKYFFNEIYFTQEVIELLLVYSTVSKVLGNNKSYHYSVKTASNRQFFKVKTD